MSEPVWEPFLTPQDKAHVKLVARGRQRSERLGVTPVLLLVDIYRWVFGDEPQPLLEAVEDWPGNCGLAAWEALPHIEELLQGAREASIPVVHITGEIEGVPPWREMRRLKAEGTEGKDDPAARDRRRRMYELMEPVTPIEGEPLIRKSSPSGFWGTPLEALLNSYGADTLIVAGESTSGCVRATVVDARSYRYNVVVVEECVFDRHESSHAISLFDMDQKYADVLSLAEVLTQFREFAGR